MTRAGTFRAALACLVLGACAPTGGGVEPDETTPAGAAGGTADTGGAGGGGGAAGAAGGGPAGSSSQVGTLGIVVIDVQEAFVGTAANADITGIIARTKSTLQLAADHAVPVFVTFEASQQGDHALHAPLVPFVPQSAGLFVKTTFAATGLPAFSLALEQSALSHLVVLGAETDVCVLQTVLGLRRAGFTVLLEQDAVFSSEPNASPARRRMFQAGALPVGQTQVAEYAANPSALPKGSSAPAVVTKPLQLGVVLNGLTDSALSSSADPLKSQKLARLRELLLVSEWFELPVYAADSSGGLPQALSPYFDGKLRPISQISQDSFVEQLVVAGTDGGLAATLGAWASSHQSFVMEDALLVLGPPGEQEATLAPFFAAGLVPTTYKSFYYDMTQSVDLDQWPSPKWAQRFAEYYDLTLAPEDLPPMPPS